MMKIIQTIQCIKIIFPLFLELPRETEGAEKAQNTGVHILSP